MNEKSMEKKLMEIAKQFENSKKQKEKDMEERFEKLRKEELKKC